jgi:hypothetical protein
LLLVAVSTTTGAYCRRTGGPESKFINGLPENTNLVAIPNSMPPLWSGGHTSWLQSQRSRVRFPALPDFMTSSKSGTGCTQPREDKIR